MDPADDQGWHGPGKALVTFIEKQFKMLEEEARRLGRKLTKTEWMEFSQRLYDGEHKKRTPRRDKPIASLTDEEFLDFLEKEPSLAGVDVKKEIGKCQFHWKLQGILATRKHITNWLKKADRSLEYRGEGQSSKKVAVFDVYVEPPDWAKGARQKYGDDVGEAMIDKGWFDLDTGTRRDILVTLARYSA